jgi:HSP20 family protein
MNTESARTRHPRELAFHRKGGVSEIVVFAALPGYAPDSINVEATAEQLTISGERKPLYEDQNAALHRQNWVSGAGRFQVSYALPVEIEPNKVQASFQNGVLKLEMAKAEHVKRRTVKVNVLSK